MNRVKSLLSDTLILAFGTLGGRVVGILLLPVYTYTLSRTEFGTVDLMTTSLDLVLPLLFLSVSEAVLRFAMSPGERSGDVLRTALTFVAAGSFVALLAAGIAAIWLPASYTGLVVAILIVQAINVVLGAWGRATGRVKIYAVSGLVQALGVGCGSAVFLLALDLGVPGFLLSLLAGYVASCLVLLHRMPFVSSMREGSFDRPLLRRMLLFSAPLVPNVILWWLTNISGRYFLAFTHGVDEVGVFSVASRFPALVIMVTTVFAQAWQLAANRSADGEDDDRARFYSDVFRFYAAVLFLSISSLVLVLKPLMRAVTSPPFYEAWQAVPPLLVGAMFAAFASFYGVIYTSARRSIGVFKTSLVAGLGSLALNSVLIPRLGVAGAALSISLSFLGLWLLRVADSQSITRTSIAPGLLLAGALLLGAQISLQYSSLPSRAVYPLMVGAWIGLVMLFRSEVVQAWRGINGALADGRPRGSSTDAGGVQP